jgi:hypothetical protein
MVRGTGLTGATQLGVLAGPDQTDRSDRCYLVSTLVICFVHILSY